MNSKYLKGEIANVDLGLPPIAIKGHEQAMQRPCMIVKAFDNLKLAIVVPFTSKKKSDYFYSIVEIKKGNGGLSKDSYLLCHQIRSISYERIKSKVGILPQQDIYKVTTVIADTLDIS